MAYLAFPPVAGGIAEAALIEPLTDAGHPPRDGAGFSALEWSVIAIARRDSLATLREPSRIAMAMGALFGGRHDARLADPRLEALRRLAVLTWHHGYIVPASAVRDFLAAKFTADQYEVLVGSISAGRAAARSRRFRR